jgi:hypothetical protein
VDEPPVVRVDEDHVIRLAVDVVTRRGRRPGYAFTTVPPFARTTKRIASIIEFGFGVEVKAPDHELARAMEAAHAELRERCPKSEVARMAFSVDDDG